MRKNLFFTELLKGPWHSRWVYCSEYLDGGLFKAKTIQIHSMDQESEKVTNVLNLLYLQIFYSLWNKRVFRSRRSNKITTEDIEHAFILRNDKHFCCLSFGQKCFTALILELMSAKVTK